jgi:hypothetical protein
MVHMGMRDEDVGHFEDVTTGQCCDVTNVKKERTLFVAKGHKQGWVLERTVYQPWEKMRAHGID